MTNPVPPEYSTATIVLVVKRSSSALEFYQQAFGAEETFRLIGPGGRVARAEMQIGDSRLMLAVESTQQDLRSPASLGGTASLVHLFVPDVDATFARAVEAGAKIVQPLEDKYWGDRSGQVEDPFGHRWTIASRKEDLSAEEILARAPTVGPR